MAYLAQIRTTFALSNGTYGSPHIHRDLVDEGHESEHAWPVAPNLLAQDFTADGPDRKWGADMSCIRTAEGWLYLAVVPDLHSRLRHCA